MDVTATIVRRGLQVSGEMSGEYQLPTWGFVLLATTVLCFSVVLFMISYTFGRLLRTLLIIESPDEAFDFEPLATDDPDSAPAQPTKPRLITSSFRRTFKHLRSVGGIRGPFRGFWIFFVANVGIQWVASMVSFLPIFGMVSIAAVIATVLCAQLSLAWTHIVMSEPSPKPWFRRLPSIKLFKKVALPTAVLAIAEQFTVSVGLGLAQLSGVTDNARNVGNLTPHQQTIMSLKGFGIFAFSLVLTLLLVVPANVVLTRVQASLLPDTEETIVPFDRTFKGKLIPEIVGGSGVISMLDAWKTFDWNSRVRLVKAYVKAFILQTVVSFLFGLVLAGELFLIVGKDWSKLFPPKDGDNN